MQIQSIIRNILLMLGTYIESHGWMSQNEWAQIVGAILILGTFIWKWIVARQRKREAAKLPTVAPADKTPIVGLIIFALLCSMSYGATRRLISGMGKRVTATTTAQQVTFVEGTNTAYAGSVSVLNSGTNDVFCAVNSTTALFTNQVALGNAVIVPASMSFTFTKSNISGVWLQTTNSTASVVIGAQ